MTRVCLLPSPDALTIGSKQEVLVLAPRMAQALRMKP